MCPLEQIKHSMPEVIMVTLLTPAIFTVDLHVDRFGAPAADPDGGNAGGDP